MLATAGTESEELELTDQVLRDYGLTPPLDVGYLPAKSIGDRGTRPVPSAFEVGDSSHIDRATPSTEGMVNLDLDFPDELDALAITAPSELLSPDLHQQLPQQ